MTVKWWKDIVFVGVRCYKKFNNGKGNEGKGEKKDYES